MDVASLFYFIIWQPRGRDGCHRMRESTMPILGVNVAVIRDGKVLLTKREDFEVWCLPGGAVEDGESVAQAAIRETYEETGLDVKLSRLVGVYSRLGPVGDVHAILFSARPAGGTLRLQPGETIDVGWFRYDEIPAETMEWYRQRISDALDGVGNGVAWLQSHEISVDLHVTTRQNLYDLRDQSGLSRQDFYYQHFEQSELDELLEVGGRLEE